MRAGDGGAAIATLHAALSEGTTERANLDLVFHRDGAGITRLKRRYARYPWSLTRPFWIDRTPAGMASLIPQSASSLLLPADRVAQRLVLEAGAAAHVTSQGAQAVHGVAGGAAARSSWQLALQPQAFLELVLDPVILFPYSHLVQGFDVELGAGSCLLLSDGMTWHPDPADPAFEAMVSGLVLRRPDGAVRVREQGRMVPHQFRDMARLLGRTPVASGQVWLLFGSPRALPEVEVPPCQEAYLSSTVLPDGAGLLLRFLCFRPEAFASIQHQVWRSVRVALSGEAPVDRRKSR